MEKTQITYYCDYCGKELKDRRSKNIFTSWFTVGILMDKHEVKGDACNDCYKSFVEWKNSRKNKKG